jgi:hypothetical protein
LWASQVRECVCAQQQQQGGVALHADPCVHFVLCAPPPRSTRHTLPRLHHIPRCRPAEAVLLDQQRGHRDGRRGVRRQPAVCGHPRCVCVRVCVAQGRVWRLPRGAPA